MNSQVNSDEIDLISTLKSVILFFKKASKHIVISSVVGALLGIIIYAVTPPYYESQIGFFSDNLSDKKLFSLISDLEKFLIDNDTNQLSKALNLSKKSVTNIVSMRVSTVQEIENIENFDEKENGILVTFRVKDKALFDSLEHSIKYYVENTEYVKTRLALHKEGLIYNIAKISKEIIDLDSLKKMLDYSLTKGGRSNLYISDFGNTGAKLVEFYEKKSSLQNQLQLVSDIRVFKSFSKYNKKAGPKLLKILMLSVLFSLLVGLFIYAFPTMKKFVKEA